MGFKVEIDEITEAEILGVTTADELLAQALADYANSQVAEAQRTNQQIIAQAGAGLQTALAVPEAVVQTQAGHLGLSSVIQIEGGTRVVELITAQRVNALVPYTSTINGVLIDVKTETVKAALPAMLVDIEYKFDFGTNILTRVARMLATRALRHAALRLLASGQEENDRASVLRYILDLLEESSPRLTGTYADSFRLTGDGQEIEPEEATEDMQEFVFVNMTPYARKIEQGLSQQTPEGVFEGVAAIAAHEFDDVADISFEWREPPPEVPTRLNRTPAITVVFK